MLLAAIALPLALIGFIASSTAGPGFPVFTSAFALTGAAALAIGLRRILRARRWHAAVGYLTMLAAVTALLGAPLGFALRRGRCEAYVLQSGVFLRQMHSSIAADALAGHPIAPSLTLYLLDKPQLRDTIDSPCACGPHKPLRIGAYTLGDVLSGRVSRDTAIKSIPQPPAATWENIDRYTLCRDAAAYRTYDHRLIVGWERACAKEWARGVNVIFADGHGTFGYDKDLPQQLEWDAAARREHNLGPLPPDEPLTALAAWAPQRAPDGRAR